MRWLFGKARRRARRHAGPAEPAAVADRWSLRFEDGARLALADLADTLAAARAATDSQERARHIAGTRGALDRIAAASADPAVARACHLFGQILGAPRQGLRTRLETAAVALDTLTFLVVADDAERRREAAEALHQLERALRRADAA